MARKFLVSSRKVVPPSASKQGSLASARAAASSESSSEEVLVKQSSSSSSSEEEADIAAIVTPIIPISTPRGKQLRLDAAQSDSESYASIDSSEEEELAKKKAKKQPLPPAPVVQAPAVLQVPVAQIPVVQVSINHQQKQPVVVEKVAKHKKIETKAKKIEKEEEKVNGVRSQEPAKKRKKPDAVDEVVKRRKVIDVDNYVMSEYIRDELLLLAKPMDSTDVCFDPKKSQRFREALLKGTVKRVVLRKTKTPVENKSSKFADNLSTKLATLEKQPSSSSTGSAAGSNSIVADIQCNGGSADPTALKAKAEVLMKQARDLKYLGDREDNKSSAQKRAEYYLKSSVKCLEYCVVSEDLNNHAKTKKLKVSIRSYLTQSASLVEAAAYSFNTAGDKQMMAVCYKFAAIVCMYQFRSQRLKLECIHKELNKAHQADKAAKALVGKTTPLSPGLIVNSSTSPAAATGPAISVNSVAPAQFDFYLKETGNMFKAFELWSRSQRIDSTVLKSLTELATVSIVKVVAAMKEIGYC